MKTELSDIGAVQPLSQLIEPQPSDQLPLSFRKRGSEREAYLEGRRIMRVLAQLDRGVPRVLDHLACEHRGVRRRRAYREHGGLLDALVLEQLGEIARRTATTGIGLLPVPLARRRGGDHEV